jgi:glycosyltransferase involved in cell wall biosynthesis
MIELQRAGSKVIAVCAQGSRIESMLTEHGVDCRSFPGRSKLSPASIMYLRRLLAAENVESVHVHFHRDIWIPSIAMRNDASRKLFLSIYMGVSKKNDPFHRWIYGRVDAIFTSSEALNDRLPSLYPVPKQKIHFLPYGRDIDLYRVDPSKRKAIRASLGVREDEILIGTMVRIDPGKGALDFARSILYLDPRFAQRVRYAVIGEPTRKAHPVAGESPYEKNAEEYLAAIQELVRKESLEQRVLLPGFQADLVGTLSALDIFVSSRDEIFARDPRRNVPRTPLIRRTADDMQIKDGVSGLLYEVGNSEDLAAKLGRYLEVPELRVKHGAAAKEFVIQRHSMQHTIRELLSWYDSK